MNKLLYMNFTNAGKKIANGKNLKRIHLNWKGVL